METSANTYYASAEREEQEDVQRQTGAIGLEENVGRILNALPVISLLLNVQRQIIFCNKAYFRMNNGTSLNNVLGLRPGELLKCIHSNEMPAGCGTSESCKYCGMVNTILECQQTATTVENEARITVGKEDELTAYDLKVTASPIEICDNQYTLFTILDISHEKRRQVLEEVFFHDLLNKAGSLSCVFENLKLPPGSKKVDGVIELAANLSAEIVEEINTHKAVMEAEKGELQLATSKILTHEVLSSVAKQISFHTVAMEKHIEILPETVAESLVTDYSLLTRVLVNMFKNALEATTRNGTVTASCRKEDDNVIFSVHNSRKIEDDVRFQIFQRSFSTKSTGRGLGTYSMKLLGEKYLGGKVWFESSPDTGTIFYFKLPMQIPSGC